jgi:predicted small secreted protein
MIRKLILAFGLSAMTLTAAACNTVRGAGEDLESAANEVDEEISAANFCSLPERPPMMAGVFVCSTNPCAEKFADRSA